MPNALVMFLLAGLFGGPPPDATRTWSNAAGHQRVEAALIDYNGEKAWLRRADNRIFVVRVEELSRADRDYLVAEAQRRARTAARSAPDGFETIPYGPPRKLAELEDQRIDESSGMACSHRRPDLFWTHNDSGDEPRVYAFNGQGRNLGAVWLKDVFSYDWEDIASFTRGGKPHLLLGDTGNNGLGADVQMLHLVEEPAIDAGQGGAIRDFPVLQTIHFRFEDAHRDCEGLAVDPTSNTILLVTKERAPRCHVYAMDWPEDDATRVFPARHIAELAIPAATALDVSPDGRRAIVLTYSDAHEYHRGPNEDWSAAFARTGRLVRMPRRAQGESICYGPDGKTLYLTSEQRPTPLWEVPAGRTP